MQSTKMALGLLAYGLLAACGPGSADFDADGDGVLAWEDVDPESPWRCGDQDLDGCDDCSLAGFAAPATDGYDADQDGQCELPLDRSCMQGEFAPDDPGRPEACAMLTLANQDRLRCRPNTKARR